MPTVIDATVLSKIAAIASASPLQFLPSPIADTAFRAAVTPAIFHRHQVTGADYRSPSD